MADKPYKVIIQGENGRGDQVFEAETPEEMRDQFQNAQYHATKKIGEMSQENAQLRQLLLERQQNGNGNGAGFDNQKYLELTFSNGQAAIDYALAHNHTAQAVIQATNSSILGQIINNFSAQHPEFSSLSEAEKNKIATTLDGMLTERNMEVSVPALNDMYTVAHATGKLSVPNAQLGGAEIVMQPVPTTVTRPSTQINTSESEQEFLRTAPTEKVRAYLEKKYDGVMPR